MTPPKAGVITRLQSWSARAVLYEFPGRACPTDLKL